MTSKKEQFYIQRIAELEMQVAELTKLNAELSALVAQLTDKVAKLSKNSSNSSKPPRKAHTTQGKIGGQLGHPKHERLPFSTIRKYLRDIVGITISRGQLVLPQLEMDKSFKSVILLWTFLKGIWYEQATQTI